MIFPKDFENKIGFSPIRLFLSEKCDTLMGKQLVTEMRCLNDFNTLNKELGATNEMKGFSGIRQNGFQEMQIVSMAKNITKYSVTANTAQGFAEIVNRAYNMCNLGRKGGVLIDFPLNIQQADLTIG